MGLMDKWKNAVSAEEEAAVQKAMDEQKQNSYREVPAGDYIVGVEKIEIGQASWGDDQVSIWFKVLEGDYKNSRIFYSGTFDDNWLHGINPTAILIADLIDDEDITAASIGVILGSHTRKGGMEQIEEFLADTAEEIVDKRSYDLTYSIDNKKSKDGSKTYKNRNYMITGAYDLVAE